MANGWRARLGLGLASGLALAPGACHSGLRLSRDAAVDAPSAADRPEPGDLTVVPDAIPPDTLDVGTADAGWLMPDGLGPICGTLYRKTVSAPVDILAVVERSSSMTLALAAEGPCQPGEIDCMTRWEAVRLALSELTRNYPRLRWGTLLFPTPGGGACEVAATPQVPVPADPVDAIELAMSSTTPAGDSPTAAALGAAVAHLASLADSYEKMIVLFTDGEPSCEGVDGDAAGAEAVAAAGTAWAAGYQVYVIGLGPSPGDLDRLAKAGGTTSYYPVASRQQLDRLVQPPCIGCSLASPCTLGGVEPPDPTRVYVYLNGAPVPRDEVDGWTFRASSSTFLLVGSYCDMATSLESVEVAIYFGCPEPMAPDGGSAPGLP